MNAGPIFKKVIYSSWFLAGIPAIIVMLLLPPVGSKYRLEITQPEKNAGKYIYSDLNSDSISELVVTGKGGPYYYIAAWNIDRHIFDQWNLSDSLCPGISEVFFGNYDHDRFSEIYVFTHSGDSLFLNVNEILQPSGTILNRMYITQIGYFKGEVAAALRPAGFYDADGDGKDELYFSISSYYRLGTLRMYYYDLVKRSLISSRFFGNIIIQPEIDDVDGDGNPEIFGAMSGSGKYNTNVPYPDSSTWLMVFDYRLRFEFPPVEFPGFANGLFTFPYRHDKFRGYVLSHDANGADTALPESRIMIYTREGLLVRSRVHDDFSRSGTVKVYVVRSSPSDRIFVIGDKLFELNETLEVIRSAELPYRGSIISSRTDVNGDGEDEFLLYSEDEKWIAVYNSEFQKLSEIMFYTPDTIWKLYPFLSKSHEYQLFMASGEDGYFMKMRRNNYYFLGYFLHPAIYLSFIIFIVLIKRIGTYQQKTRESLNNRLINLQLQGIKAQLDPHFTFNTLNSIASLIYLEDRKAAYDYMLKFTELLRCMLNDAEKIYRNLGEELAFVTTYLDLEKLRFGDKLSYEIEIGEGVSQLEQVPKLVLQTFTENAVKHGIMPSEKGGRIKISAVKEKDYLKLTIEDNGIGREQAAGSSNSTGKGLRLANEFYEILNQINKKPIKHLITDLYNKSLAPSGTMVEIWVPAEDFTNHKRT